MSNPDLTQFLASAETPVQGYGNRLWYLASPFTHPDPSVMGQRLDAIQDVVAGIIKKHSDDDIFPFSPILYTATLAGTGVTPRHGWYKFDLFILDRCDVLKVVKIDGWQESLGIQLEIAYALGKGIPVDYVNPELYEVG